MHLWIQMWVTTGSWLNSDLLGMYLELKNEYWVWLWRNSEMNFCKNSFSSTEEVLGTLKMGFIKNGLKESHWRNKQKVLAELVWLGTRNSCRLRLVYKSLNRESGRSCTKLNGDLHQKTTTGIQDDEGLLRQSERSIN